MLGSSSKPGNHVPERFPASLQCPTLGASHSFLLGRQSLGCPVLPDRTKRKGVAF